MENENLEYIKTLFPFVSEKQQEQFLKLPALYKQWNEKINVISRKDIDNLFAHHILHSLTIGKICPFLPNASVLDVGTGGGFPGIPLAILFPQTRFHLIDRTAKKIKVVNAIKESLGLENVIAQQIACEELKQKYDFIVSRAVTNMKDFLSLSKGRISSNSSHRLPNGILYLKGKDAYEEMVDYKGYYQIYDLENIVPLLEYYKTKCLVYISLSK